jgi:L-gulonolactone oxidase
MTVTNWNATARFDPALDVTPDTLDDLVAIVQNTFRTPCPTPVRAVGSLHSLNRCVATAGTLVRMKAAPFRHIAEPAGGAVTVGAGVTMFELQKFLKKRGLQIAVTPEIGNATAGSVACCGTKDASLAGGPGQISSTVVGVKMIDAAGEKVEVTEAQPEQLRIVRSSYGLLGIVYEVTFATVPLQTVRYKSEVFDVPGVTLAELLGPADGFLAFLLPYNDKIVVERRTLVTGDEPNFVDDLRRKARNQLWATGGHPFSDKPELFAKQVEHLLPLLSFVSERVDVMIDFESGDDHFFDFGFWAFPVSRWPTAVPDFLAFCKRFTRETGFRPDLPTEVYLIKRDRQALLSFSPEEDIFTLDMVHTLHRPARPDEALWDEMNRRFNAFAVERGGRPLLNQTKQLSRDVVRASLGADWETFKVARATADAKGRFLGEYFAELL